MKCVALTPVVRSHREIAALCAGIQTNALLGNAYDGGRL